MYGEIIHKKVDTICFSVSCIFRNYGLKRLQKITE